MEAVFTPMQGVLFFVSYLVFVFALSWVTTRNERFTKKQFLAAGHNIGLLPGAFSVAATWIWAPALFISAQKAFEEGMAGLFWFAVPNALCLILFAHFAAIVRDKVPHGYTVSGYMRERFSDRVQSMYLVELSGLTVCSFAVNLLAGGKLISILTGIPFSWVTVTMAIIALSYSLLSGIRASVVTDYVQMAFIVFAGLIFVPWAVVHSGGFGNVWAGFGGITGTYTSLFTGDGAKVFYTFGIASTIGLMAGPFGDPAFWQRVFAYKKEVVKKAFVLGALVFIMVPITMSLLGFAAAGMGLNIGNPEMVNIEFVTAFLPTWAIVFFVYMVMCGLISTLDSNLCAMSSLSGHDFLMRRGVKDDRQVLFVSRITMLLTAMLALVVANIPDMKIVYLFLFYGILRTCVFMPTVISLLSDRVHEAGMFWGILLSLLIGLPVFAYGNFNGVTSLTIAGSLLTISLSGIIAIAVSRIKERQGKLT